MSQQTSPSTQQRYGLTRVLRVWRLSRSTFYARRTRRDRPATGGRRGRPPTLDEAALLAHIRAVIAESPFQGEGHRKVWARLRVLKHVRTSKRRVLRVMRTAGLLAPTRQPQPIVKRAHTGTIVTACPKRCRPRDLDGATAEVQKPAVSTTDQGPSCRVSQRTPRRQTYQGRGVRAKDAEANRHGLPQAYRPVSRAEVGGCSLKVQRQFGLQFRLTRSFIWE